MNRVISNIPIQQLLIMTKKLSLTVDKSPSINIQPAKKNSATKVQTNSNKKGNMTVSISAGGRKQGKPGRRRRRFRGWKTRAPAAYGRTSRNRASDSSIIRGRETFVIKTLDNGTLDFMLPITPTKWVETRTRALAQVWQAFNPLHIRVEYVPYVGTQTQGSAAIGTVWAGTAVAQADNRDRMMQQLASTTGGFITTSWKPHSSKIPVRANRRAFNYPLNQISFDDIPCWILATSNMPVGSEYHIVVHYAFKMFNPSVVPINSFAGRMQAKFTAKKSGDQNSKMVIKQSEFFGDLHTGDEVLFTPQFPLVNENGATFIQILSGFIAKAVSWANGEITFDVDPNIATQQAPVLAVGRHLKAIQ